MADTKHPAEALADECEESAEGWIIEVDTRMRSAAMLRRIPALEAERGVLLAAVEEWRKLADWQSARLAKMDAERDQLRAELAALKRRAALDELARIDQDLAAGGSE